MNKIEPIEAGNERTILSATVANALADGANGINRMRGGRGVYVTHAESGIRIDLKNNTTFNELLLAGCPVPSEYSVDDSHDYYKSSATLLKCPPTVPPVENYPTDWTDSHVVSDSNFVGATETWNLADYFPHSIFWYNDCPIGDRPGSIIQSFYPQIGAPTGGAFNLVTNAYRHNPSGSTTQTSGPSIIGPLPYNASAATVQAAINAFQPAIDVGGITVFDYDASGYSGASNGWYLEYSDGLRHGPYFGAGDNPRSMTISGGFSTIQKGGATYTQTVYLPQLYSWGAFFWRLSNRWRDHPSGSLEIGPWPVKMVMFSATRIEADDGIFFSLNSGTEELLGSMSSPCVKNTPIKTIPSGQTVRLRTMEAGGAYCWASGVLGVKPYHCIPPSWRNQLGG